MRKSTEKIVQMAQRQYFSEEIDCPTDGRQVKGQSKELSASEKEYDTHRFPFDAIHPMILPRDHHVSTFCYAGNLLKDG